MRELERGRPDRCEHSDRRRPHASARSRIQLQETEGQQVVVPVSSPPEGARRTCDPAWEPGPRRKRRQAGRPRANVPLGPGSRLRLRGGMLRGGEGARHRGGRRRRDPVRGPCGGAGHARDAPRHRRDRRRGTRRRRRPDHRRAVLGGDARIHGRSRRARSGSGEGRSPRCAMATSWRSMSRSGSSA